MLPFLSTPEKQSGERSQQSNWEPRQPLPSAPLNRCVWGETSVDSHSAQLNARTLKSMERAIGRARGGRGAEANLHFHPL